jgi:hypothetical protein
MHTNATRSTSMAGHDAVTSPCTSVTQSAVIVITNGLHEPYFDAHVLAHRLHIMTIMASCRHRLPQSRLSPHRHSLISCVCEGCARTNAGRARALLQSRRALAERRGPGAPQEAVPPPLLPPFLLASLSRYFHHVPSLCPTLAIFHTGAQSL